MSTPAPLTIESDSDAYMVNEPARGIVVQYMTPHRLAQQLAELAQLEPEHIVLEPSAGNGRLADAIHAAGVPKEQIVVVDINPNFGQLLQRKGYVEAYGGDFLAFPHRGSRGRFDRIVMNPPFEHDGEDVTHIGHAWPLLRVGGHLVAVVDRITTMRQVEAACRGGVVWHFKRNPKLTFSVDGKPMVLTNTVAITKYKHA